MIVCHPNLYQQISLCFQKIAAEVLGVRMTKQEIEQQSVSFEVLSHFIYILSVTT